MVANILARPIPITELAITRTGGLPTVTAFTSRPEKIARPVLASGEAPFSQIDRKVMKYLLYCPAPQELIVKSLDEMTDASAPRSTASCFAGRLGKQPSFPSSRES
jgi:hypothetical protein